MCYNCGCQNPEDKMGHDDNITESTFQKLADKWGKSVDETKKEVLKAIEDGKVKENPDINTMFEKASRAWGQDPQEAQDNAKDLLSQ